MSKELEEEVFAPGGAAHFTADRVIGRMHSQGVLGETADDRKVFRSVVFSGARRILIEYDIENPVQLVLDTQ